MENCPKCLSALETGVAFCPVCGTRASSTVKCPQCRHTATAQDKFCRHCGDDLEVTQVRPGSSALPPTYTNPLRGTSTLFQDYAGPGATMSGDVSGEKVFWFGVKPVITATVLLLFISASGLAYISSLKTETQQLKNQLAEKQQAISDKEQEVRDKSGQVANLAQTNSGLSEDLAEKEKQLDKKDKELSRRLAEVKKLQGSVKTVGRCLVGTLGVFEAVRQDNREMALRGVSVMESNCQEAGSIIQRVEGFSTGATANQ